MNKENAKDFLPLVQALAEGKVIQYKYSDGWDDAQELDFGSDPSRYRIKQEPRRIWMNEYASGNGIEYHTKEEAISNALPNIVRIAVEYVEVIK